MSFSEWQRAQRRGRQPSPHPAQSGALRVGAAARVAGDARLRARDDPGKYDRTTTPTGTRLAVWGDTWKRFATERNFGIIDTLRAIATERGTTVAAVAIAWLLARPETSSIILGARTVEQLDGNLAALSVTLSPEERKRLDDTVGR